MTTGGILGALLLTTVAFIDLSPQLGGTPTKTDQQRFAQSGHYADGEFQNLLPTKALTGGNTASVLWNFIFHKNPCGRPPGPLPTQPLDSLTIVQKTPTLVRMTWFGHSASLVDMAGQNILLDPMLSVGMAPLPLVTPKRYDPRLAITPEQLPPIATVLISHDHLDHQTIRKIKGKTGYFYVPLGIGAQYGPGAWTRRASPK